MDTVDRQTRSKIMASVGQKDTGAELVLRRALHKIGLRYKLHDRTLPGSPDLVLPRFHAVIFVHGCYWHSHGCHRATVPKNRHEFWVAKFKANRSRDKRNVRSLLKSGWRVLIVWECVLLGNKFLPAPNVINSVCTWLNGTNHNGQIPGNPYGLRMRTPLS
jgi:DNA mismatch endonuclease (patch repair protein)